MKAYKLTPLVRVVLALLVSAASISGPPIARAQQDVLPSPEQHFGFQMGTDRMLVDWDELLEYYQLLDARSDKLQVVELGKTSEGRPYIALFISSPANLSNLERLREVNARLADPRGLSEAEARNLVAEGRAVIIQSFGLHSSEVAATQTAAEYVYDSLSRTDPEAVQMLENVISIVIPSANPDGTQMITDWYMEYVGTPHEAAGLPWLYQTYAGHDNNRDAFSLNLPESQLLGKLMYRDWIPQAYVDHHQMGGGGARLYIPPYAEPIRPGGDPLVWREMSWWGAQMGTKLEAAGKTGVIGYGIYSGWGHMGFHWITPFHNIAGMLTESASARLATPVFMHFDQIRVGQRNLPEYESQVNMPSLWPGGWWRVRDIVEQQKIAAWATVDLAARNRETVLWNMYLKAFRQTERGMEAPVKAYVIEAAQHDPLTTKKLVNLLLKSGVEVHQSPSELVVDGRFYSAGSFVVSMAQPKQGLVRWMLGQTFYPDNSYTRNRDGTPIRPYDLATDAMTEFMGVRSDPVSEPVTGDLVRLSAELPLAGSVAPGTGGYLLSGRLNDSFRAVSLLQAAGATIRRAREGEGYTPGDFLVTGVSPAAASDIASRSGVDFATLPSTPPAAAYELSPARIGMYKRFGGGNMDEGWTRLMFEQFEIPFTSVPEREIQAGNLRRRYDVIILPADGVAPMLGERPENAEPDITPPEYRSGFGEEGVEALDEFVRAGGTLVTFAQAGDLPITRFGLPVRNVVAGLSSTEFWSPGSTLRIRVDNRHPIGYGMPSEALALFLAGCQAYEVTSVERSRDVEIIATFPDRDILRSGWLLGEERIANKAAAVSVRHGDGRVILIGFRPQHRDQTHGTFKLVFNSLLQPAVAADVISTSD